MHAHASRSHGCLSPRTSLLAAVAGLIVATASHAAEPNVPAARRLPHEGLVAYVEYDGLAAHRDAWRATAASAIIDRTPAGSMAAEVSRQVLDQVLKSAPRMKLRGTDILAVLNDLVDGGFALAVYDRGGSTCCVLVGRGLGRPEARRRLESVRDGLLAAGDGMKLGPPVRVRGRAVYHVAADPEPTQSFWFEGDDLFAVFSDAGADPAGKADNPRAGHNTDIEVVCDAIDGKAKTVSAHEGYAAAMAEGKDLGGFDADGLGFVEVSGHYGLLNELAEGIKDRGLTGARYRPIELPSAPYIHDDVRYLDPASVAGAKKSDTPAAPTSPPVLRIEPVVPKLEAIPDGRCGEPAPKPEDAPAKAIDEAELLGLRGIKRLIVRWGFQGKGLVTVVRAQAPAPRRGLLALVDQPAFTKDRLPPIPRGVTSFAIGSFDPARGYGTIAELFKSVDPDVRAVLAASEQAVRDATGLRLREDLLPLVGPSWCTFDLTEQSPGRAEGLSPGQVVVVQVRDAEKFVKLLDTAAANVNHWLRGLEHEGAKDAAGDADRDLPALALERLPAPDRGYQLASPAGLVFWLDDDLRPAVLVGKSYAVIASHPRLARAVLAAESAPAAAWQAEGELARTLAGLPGALTSISVADAAASPWPEAVAKLPAYVQILANWIDPSAADAEVAPASAVLALVGVPRPAGFRVRIDPSRVPKPDAVRAHLFPSVLATTVDDRGLRWVAREAFPLAGAAGATPVKPKFKVDLTQPAGNRLKVEMNLMGIKTK